MTHNELLKRIQGDYEENKHFRDEPKWKPFAALRAVVELHKPYGIDEHPTLKSYCTHCEHLASQIWPCPTIQAIEKELG